MEARLGERGVPLRASFENEFSLATPKNVAALYRLVPAGSCRSVR